MPRVDSSAVERVEYTPEERILDIWYTGGGRYAYLDVPPALYEELLGASSIGAFVNQRIKDHFAFREITSRRRFRPRDV
jgi:hypothetical protein